MAGKEEGEGGRGKDWKIWNETLESLTGDKLEMRLSAVPSREQRVGIKIIITEAILSNTSGRYSVKYLSSISCIKFGSCRLKQV